MNTSNKLLSDIAAFRTYAKYLPNFGRRESLEETINRDLMMQLERFPKLSRDIMKAFQKVHELKIMPSMRGLQFAGDAILKNNVRQYNCSYTPIDHVKTFSEILFLLLSGVGVGYSVQKTHISKLPRIGIPREEGRFIIHDSIVGWAQAVDALMDGYFNNSIRPIFDFTAIRPKGSYLVTTGAKAPGPEPLKYMLQVVEGKLKAATGRKLKPIEVHDIVCLISDCVLAGGIRRAALISLFDRDDSEMLKAKSGDWWVKHPYRARANNSAILPRNEVTKEEFLEIFKACQDSGAGEPGFSWTSNPEWGFNPCVTGDTEILTKAGYCRIDSLVDQKVEIWNGFEWSEVTPKITGTNQKILTITFSDGRILNCTPYHKFHIAKDYKGGTEIVEARDLESGMKLIKHEFPVVEGGVEYEHAYTQGFISAEGMDNYKFCWIYGPKKSALSRLTGGQLTSWNETYDRGYYTIKHTPLPKSFVPFNWSVKSKLDWLSGLIDGDGVELKEGGLQLTSVDRRFLSNVQQLLSTLGVQSKVTLMAKSGMRSLPDGNGNNREFYCQDTYRILVGAVQMQTLKKLGLNCTRMKFDKTPNRDASQFVTVVDVTENGEAEKVYCFNEPKRHLGIFGGVITGQCHEISLQPNQFCNLTTINQTGILNEKDFLDRVYSATLLGTLQASYTDFPFLRDKWRIVTENEALIGCSFTGIADSGGIVTPDLLQKGAALCKEVNEKYAKKIGINPASRLTAIKPEGTSSTVLGSSSGIHARHSQYYLRRIRINKNDALASYLMSVVPELVEDDVTSSNGIVVTIPQESPKNAILRENETALDLFDRALMYNKNWVAPGHRSGDNMNNVSCTISVRDHEWKDLAEVMWDNRHMYSGISLLPFDGGSYKQAPFESCTQEKYEELSKLVKEIDLKQVKEDDDNTNRMEQIACAGGVCEISL